MAKEEEDMAEAGNPDAEGERPSPAETTESQQTRELLAQAASMQRDTNAIFAQIAINNRAAELRNQGLRSVSQEQLDENPEIYTRLDNEARQMAMAELQAQRRVLFQTPEPRAAGINPQTEEDEAGGRLIKSEGGMDTWLVDTASGYKQEIRWPHDEKDGIARMRETLLRIEKTLDDSGGQANETELRRLINIISFFRTSGNDEQKKLGDRMFEEYYNRMNLYQRYIQFNNAGGAEEVNKIESALRDDQLDFFFKGHEFKENEQNENTPDKARNLLIRQAFNLIEVKSREYHKATTQDLGKFLDETIRGDLRQQVAGQEYSETDLESAVMLADRLWQILGRRVQTNILIDQTTGHEISLEHAIKKCESFKDASNQVRKDNLKFGFLGNVSGGNYTLQRIVKFSEYCVTQVENARIRVGLLEHFNLGAYDAMSDIPSKIEDQYKAEGLSEDEANEVARFLVGESNYDATLDKFTRKPKGWKKGSDFNPSLILWDGKLANGQEAPGAERIRGILAGRNIPLEALGVSYKYYQGDGHPLVTHGYRQVQLSDVARDNLSGKRSSFLRTPNAESLKATADIFAQLGVDQYSTSVALASNLVKEQFLHEDPWFRIDRMTANMEIGAIAFELGLNSEDAKEMARRVFENDDPHLHWLLMGVSYFKPGTMMRTFLWELLKGILAEGMQIKIAPASGGGGGGGHAAPAGGGGHGGH